MYSFVLNQMIMKYLSQPLIPFGGKMCSLGVIYT